MTVPKKSSVLTETEVAAALKVSLSTVRRWRRAKLGPKFLKIGRLVRYPKREVENFAGSGRKTDARTEVRIERPEISEALAVLRKDW